MISQTGTLWHYLGSFVLYTLLAIGLIYAAYFYTRKHGAGLLPFSRRSGAGRPRNKLAIESVLPLEPRKNLYVVRVGAERFLLSTSMEGTQFLSRLESDSVEAQVPVGVSLPDASAEALAAQPWYTQASAHPDEMTMTSPGMGARLMQSMQWLMAARSGGGPGKPGAGY